MSEQTTTEPINESEPAPSDRRALLRKLAIGGAGAAAGVAMLKSGTASAAAEPGALNLGESSTNTSTTPTSLVHTPPAARTEGPSTLSVGSEIPGATAPFPANVGGYGNSLVANGLHGSTTAPAGFGVVAANLSDAAAAATDPVPTAQAVASPNGAHMLLLAGSKSGPAAGKHVAGEVYVDKDGTLWFTVPTATAGVVRFVRLAGTTTSGSYNAITPQRAYDSRQPDYAVKGVLAPNTSRVVSVADGHDSRGTVTLANAVPAGATAVVINLTATGQTGPNYLSVTGGDETSTATSLLNWDAGVLQIANSITVPVNAKREIKVFCGDQAGSTHFIVDVFGYYI